MRASELREREDLDGLMAEALAAGWSQLDGRPVEVRPDPAGPGQPWLEHDLLSALYAPAVGRRARRWLADSFRGTTARGRAAAQWALGTALATAPALRLLGRPALRVRPPRPHAEALVILPGNQRIRVLDFHAGTSQVFLKPGFDPRAIAVEAAVRGPGRRGPFVPLTRVADDGTWFEEPLVDGLPLSRATGRRRREGVEAALEALVGWLDATREATDGARWAACLEEALRADLAALAARFPTAGAEAIAARLPALLDAAEASGPLTLARSHGDFQPGNVLLPRRGAEALLIDWEYSALRTRAYDLLAWGLAARSPAGLAGRVRAWVRDGHLLDVAPRVPLPDPAERRRAAARFLLEDLARVAGENLSGPYARPGASWRLLAAELAALGDDPAAWGRG